jgi:hypothetical protein
MAVPKVHLVNIWQETWPMAVPKVHLVNIWQET